MSAFDFMLDLFRDEEDHIWIGVHFGSRGLGHKSATKYLALAGGRDGMDVAPAALDEGSELDGVLARQRQLVEVVFRHHDVLVL